MTTAANYVTAGRIAAVPVIVFAALMAPTHGAAWSWLAAVVVTLAAISDYLDGVLARAQGNQSVFGTMLDPIADKVLVAAGLAVLIWNGTLGMHGTVAAIIILSREFLVAGLREGLAISVRRSLPVIPLAKAKTVAQLAAICVLFLSVALVGDAPGTAAAVWTGYTGAGLLWIAALLSGVTAASYVRSVADGLAADGDAQGR